MKIYRIIHTLTSSSSALLGSLKIWGKIEVREEEKKVDYALTKRKTFNMMYELEHPLLMFICFLIFKTTYSVLKNL